ncbi:MAG: sugar transferase [Oscillibacter sp.]|jgi:undecaprenyl phosphate N,N'-diacetylbacillosamine 1-phosphate transferase|nr:sugar transferase [Oscillibacter sp.]
MYRHFFKRFFDIVLSFCALVVLSPVLLVLAILVRLKLGRPVVFRQERPGKDEKIFQLCKFRSMTDQRDGNGELLPDEVRLTKFGKALRSTSLDELPELWNILKGDMSIVGPRPLLVKYLPYYTEEERKRHDVRPGLTGMAQTHGRNLLSWEERFALDLQYIEQMSLLLDIKIVFLTVKKVFSRSDIALGEAETHRLRPDAKIRDFDVERRDLVNENQRAVY